MYLARARSEAVYNEFVIIRYCMHIRTAQIEQVLFFVTLFKLF